jgi:tellurite resistance protein TehA-like permease
MTPTTSPLSGFQSPFSSFFSGVNPIQAFEIAFCLVFFVWVIYTFVIAYHWFRYGHQSKIGVTLLVTHLVVSGFLFVMAASGFLSSLLMAH